VKVIINADDFGSDRTTSDAIMESLRRGLITQTTAMVNRPDADRAIAEAKAEGFGGAIGLHLNLTDGDPLTDRIKSCPLFCGADGRFNDGAATNAHFLLPYKHDDTMALAAEIEAQAVKYLDFGLSLKHVDSHSHVHFRVPIARIAFPILSRLGFKTVRRPYTQGAGTGLHAYAKKVRNALFVLSARKNAMRIADEFVAFVPDDCSMGEKVVEIMVHPRYYKGAVVNTTNYDTGDGPGLQDFVAKAFNGKNAVCSYADV